jgi:hypothetical protein
VDVQSPRWATLIRCTNTRRRKRAATKPERARPGENCYRWGTRVQGGTSGDAAARRCVVSVVASSRRSSFSRAVARRRSPAPSAARCPPLAGRCRSPPARSGAPASRVMHRASSRGSTSSRSRFRTSFRSSRGRRGSSSTWTSVQPAPSIVTVKRCISAMIAESSQAKDASALSSRTPFGPSPSRCGPTQDGRSLGDARTAHDRCARVCFYLPRDVFFCFFGFAGAVGFFAAPGGFGLLGDTCSSFGFGDSCRCCSTWP